MTAFDPEVFVGKAAAELEAFLQGVDQGALASEWRNRAEWLQRPRVRGGMLDDPSRLQSRHLFPADIGFDLPAEHPPVVVPNLDILRYLGGGTFGWVYVARVRTTGLIVALKVLRTDRGDDTARTAANEALMGAKLKHRNIVRVFDLRPIGQYWLIVMELVVGDDLSAAQVQIVEWKRIFGSLADAVHHMSHSNVVHRDLKPHNIIVRRTDRSPVIVDLGLSVDLQLFDPSDAGLAGTPLFMPPEAIDGVITNAFDAYSLGVTAAGVLAKDRPVFSGDMLQLFAAKKSGRFQEQLIASVGGTDGPMGTWIGRLTADDVTVRLAALDEGRAWIDSFQ